MSEKYGPCKRCKGMGLVMCPVLFVTIECGSCNGCGFSGDHTIIRQREAVEDHDADNMRKPFRELRTN